MVRLLIIFGITLAIAVVTGYIIFTVYKKLTKPKPTMTNNEYDNYPQD